MQLVVPPGALTGLAGATLWHAYVLFDPTVPLELQSGYASNAVPLRLVP